MSLHSVLIRVRSSAYGAVRQRCRGGLKMDASSASAESRQGSRQLATQVQAPRRRSSKKSDEDVVFQSLYGLRRMILNRPEKLNSLNESMIRKMVPRMKEWEKSDMANVIVLKGAGEKAFCAGGDVVALVDYNRSGPNGWSRSAHFFAREYSLDHYIAAYNKPFIAFMDGITMGGGVGLSIHAPFRIATERTVFAMPETAIGLFPDVGASFFLPRLNGSLGTYLALTGTRLFGPDVFYTGIATHYLHSTSLPDLEARLAEIRFRDEDPLDRRLQLVNDTLEEFSTGLTFDQPMTICGEHRRAIDRCFGRGSLREIIAALGEETGENAAWAQKKLAELETKSPTALQVAFQQMQRGRKWKIAETFQREHQMASKFMRHHDFNEGVDKRLRLKKQTPHWKPVRLEDGPETNESVEAFFEFDEKTLITLMTDKTYSEYPHASFGVPSEREIQGLVAGNSLTDNQLIKKMVASRNGRQGIADIVKDVISRKTVVDAKGKLTWADN